MRQIKTVAELKNAIKELEFKQSGEWPALREKFLATVEVLKPHNGMKSTFQKIVSDPDVKTVLLNGALGLTTGFVTNSVLRGIVVGPISKWIGGAIVGLATTQNVSKAIAGFRWPRRRPGQLSS